MKEFPKVSILIPHKNGEKIIENCLKSLKKTNYPNLDVHVLLNQTKDNSEKYIKKYKVKIYKSLKNLGFAGGINFLINKTKAKSKYLIIMNNDIEVNKNWVTELVKFAEKSDGDAFQPKILALKNKKMFEYAGAAGGFIDKYGYPFCRGRVFDNLEEDKAQYNSTKRIFWASGACMMIKSEILNKTGLLDEDFFMYAEEIDLCWRINLVGGKIFSVPNAKVYHLGNFSVNKEKMNAKKEFLLHRNTLIVFLKNYSKKSLIKLIIPRLLLEIVSGVFFPKKTKPVFSSLLWIFKNRKKLIEKNKDIQKLRIVDEDNIKKLMLNKSLAYLYFIRNKKTFKELEKYFI